MAKAGKRRIPAKQGTKRGRTAPKKAIRKAVEPKKSLADVQREGKAVWESRNEVLDAMPFEKPAPRKVLVRALRLGEYDGKYRAPNEEFTMEVQGELPYWVTKVGSD